MEGIVVEGMFGKTVEETKEIMTTTAQSFAKKPEVIVLAQASMAGNVDAIETATGIKTVASPVYGARAVKCAYDLMG